MLERFLVVLGQVATLFLLMGVGFALGKAKKLTAAGTSECSSLLLTVVAPCVIIDSFQADFDPALLRSLGVGAAAQVLCYALYAVLVTGLFRAQPPQLRSPFRFGAMYGNVGFMGLPLIQAIMGDEAMIYAVLGLCLFNILVWSHGVILMRGSRGISWKKALLTPGILGAAIGLPLFLTHTTLPGILGTSVRFMGSLNTPLAMVVIGAQMARADLAATFRDLKLYSVTAVKLLVIPLLTALVMLPLRGDRLLYVSFVILSGAPTAGITSMFAEQFDRSPERSAQLVSLSTLLSIATLPVVAVLAESIAALP